MSVPAAIMESVEVRQTPDKGRAMFATRPIKKGATIFEETPFVSAQFAWNASYRYLACEFCLRPLETAEQNVRRLTGESVQLPFADSVPYAVSPVHCGDCGVPYCSEQCRQTAAERYHGALCLFNDINDLAHPANALMDAWKKIHYPPETTSFMLIVKLLGMYQQANDRAAFLELLKEFQDRVVDESATIEHKMLGPNFESQLNELYPLYVEAFRGDRAGHREPAQPTDFGPFLTPAAFKTFFAIIGTNGQGLGTSAFADWVSSVTDRQLSENERTATDMLIDDLYERLDSVTGLQFLNNEGSALYFKQSKINHSCVPNASATFPYANHTLVLEALQDIAAGDEICISYLDECVLERSRHSRQKELQQNYMFVCRCAKCERQLNDADVTSEEDDDDAEDDDDMDEN